MKKFAALILAFSLVLSLCLAACDSQAPDQTQAPTQSTAAPTESKPTPTVPPTTQPTEPQPPKDYTGNGVTIPGAAFPAGTVLDAQVLPDSSEPAQALSALIPDAHRIEVFELTAQLDGTPVQPSAEITVLFPLPAGYDSSKHLLSLYHLSPDGTPEPIAATVTDRGVEAVLPHFSTFATVLHEAGCTAADFEDLASRIITANLITWNRVLFLEDYNTASPDDILQFLSRYRDLSAYTTEEEVPIGNGYTWTQLTVRLPPDVATQLAMDAFGYEYDFSKLGDRADDYDNAYYDAEAELVVLIEGGGFGGMEEGYTYKGQYIREDRDLTLILEYVHWDYEAGTETPLYTTQVRLTRLENGAWQILSCVENK